MKDKEKEGSCGSCGGGCKNSKEIAYEAENILHGPYNTYDPDEDIFTEGEIKEGRQHGLYAEYYGADKKQLKTKGSYLNGLLHGEWVYYDSSGSIVKKDIYNEGRLVETKK